jgi:hypothetical protein
VKGSGNGLTAEELREAVRQLYLRKPELGFRVRVRVRVRV